MNILRKVYSALEYAIVSIIVLGMTLVIFVATIVVYILVILLALAPFMLIAWGLWLWLA